MDTRCVEGAPLAAILVDNSVRRFPLTNYILRDLVATVIDIDTADGVREVVLTSAYFPEDDDDFVPAEVHRLVQLCR